MRKIFKNFIGRDKIMKIVKTHTGKIYVDTERQLEFLTVGDYGKENNI